LRAALPSLIEDWLAQGVAIPEPETVSGAIKSAKEYEVK